MIRYGLKLWTKNETSLFQEAAARYAGKEFDFIELYHHPECSFDENKFAFLSGIPVSIHNTHDRGWHEFILGREQLDIWQSTLRLAVYFNSPTIVVHPGKNHTFQTFARELTKINDPRILIENMAGLDLYHEPMYAQKIEELKEIVKLNPICFDFEKAVKAAAYQKIEYKKFIAAALEQLKPRYFHISGGDINNPVDEHLDLMGTNIDFLWIKEQLKRISRRKSIFLVFETPRVGGNLHNDLVNMDFFRSL